MKNDKIRVEEILHVYRIVGNASGSHTEYKLDGTKHCQLLYKLRGEAVITFNGKAVTEKADNVRFLPAATAFHKAPDYTADVIEEGESINIAFVTSSPLPCEILVKDFSKFPAVKEAFQKIERYWYYKRDGYYYKCMSVLYDIFAKISAETSYISSKTYNQISTAIDYIDNHFTEREIDCDYLSELCGISHTYMTKIFKKHFGTCPNNYIIHKKIEYAADLLKTREYTMSTIAEMAGFSSPYYFSRVFKKHIGVSPSQYSASVLKE